MRQTINRFAITVVLLIGLATAALGYNVPAVNPVRSKNYKIGVYYFPGWNTATRWLPIKKTGYPKPLLGYYREGEPEVAEWQLKWAAEHGIDFFIYDWYWNGGSRSLEHALLDGYLNAKNRKYVKFCLLWANHNPAGTTSEADLMNVTDYWLANYFHRPEYFTIDGKPVVIIFLASRIRQDLGGSVAVKIALEKMRAKMKSAGFSGIYLVASQDFDASQAFKDEGWDAATTYNYSPGVVKNNRGSYASMVSGYEQIWNAIDANFQIPYLVPTTPGWDNTPWAGKNAVVRYGTSPARFEDMCRRAKRFMDERPVQRAPRVMICEAWNEFGEGSYIEPTDQYGFGFLDAIRNVFSDANPHHQDITPAMIGQSVPTVPDPVFKTSWSFKNDADGWDVLMGIKSLAIKDGCLSLRTSDDDPALISAIADLDCSRYFTFEVCMKQDVSGAAQLFFKKSDGIICEQDSVRFLVVGDNVFHTYRINLKSNPNWVGTVNELRFDFIDAADDTTAIKYIRIK